jgi:predicted nucleic acid-binding protein
LSPSSLIGRWSSFLSVPSPSLKSEFGIELLAEPNRRAELNEWLTHKVRPMFEHWVLQVTEDIMLKWRLLVEVGRKTGHVFSQPDLLIAATAIQHDLNGRHPRPK